MRAYAAALDGNAQGGFCATEAWDDAAAHLAYLVGPDRQRDLTPLSHIVTQRREELLRGVSPTEVSVPPTSFSVPRAALDVAAVTVRAAMPPATVVTAAPLTCPKQTSIHARPTPGANRSAPGGYVVSGARCTVGVTKDAMRRPRWSGRCDATVVAGRG